MAPRNTLGGHACFALGLLVMTGAIGRYFYSFVPRAANGQELALDELNGLVAAESTEWDRFGRGFGEDAQREIRALVSASKWRGNFFTRIVALLSTQATAKQTYQRLQERGREVGLSEDQLQNLLALARKAYRTALFSAHYEDLRAMINSWRYFHRWLAAAMVLLVSLHIRVALKYAGVFP